MLRIRLRRTGAKKQPRYRVVVADSRAPRDGAYVEVIGHYNPQSEPSVVQIDLDKAKNWIAKGASPSDRVVRLLKLAEQPPPLPAEEEPAAKAPRSRRASARTTAARAAAAAPAETAEPETAPQEKEAPAASGAVDESA